jgi:hypothetical protein
MNFSGSVSYVPDFQTLSTHSSNNIFLLLVFGTMCVPGTFYLQDDCQNSITEIQQIFEHMRFCLRMFEFMVGSLVLVQSQIIYIPVCHISGCNQDHDRYGFLRLLPPPPLIPSLFCNPFVLLPVHFAAVQ